MRETHGKKNNPHIYDIFDQWSICHAMYTKRLKVYRQGGFKIPNTRNNNTENRDKKFISGKCLFL